MRVLHVAIGEAEMSCLMGNVPRRRFMGMTWCLHGGGGVLVKSFGNGDGDGDIGRAFLLP